MPPEEKEGLQQEDNRVCGSRGHSSRSPPVGDKVVGHTFLCFYPGAYVILL